MVPTQECLAQAIEIALRWLRRRDYSQQEMAQRLLAKGFSEETVQQTIEWLVEERWLSDDRLANHLVHRFTESQPSGRSRIEREFEQRGLAPPESLETDEETRAVHALTLRFGTPPAQADARTVARWFRFLLQRGFEPEVAENALHRWNPTLNGEQ
ncbi:MAG: regulatory protein RecX [Fimbriimonadales bacterium]